MSQINVRNLSNENDDGAPDIVGVSTFSATSYFVPPVGNTQQRPENPQEGDLRFNTDTASLEYFRGDTINWTQIEMTSPDLGGGTGSNAGLGARALFTGGQTPSNTDAIDYITISTLGNAADFGNLTTALSNTGSGASRTRGLVCGGEPLTANIEYVTFASTGNGTDFGADLTGNQRGPQNVSSQTRTCVAGGYSAGSPHPRTNTICFVTIASTGTAASDFGDLVNDVRLFNGGMACNSSTRGVWLGGSDGSGGVSHMDYITIATTGDALDFGNCTSAMGPKGNCNSTRGVWAGFHTPSITNTIEYVTIATTGNTSDFGDLTTNRTFCQGTGCSPTRGVWAGGGGPSGSPSHVNTIDYVQLMTLGNAVDFGDTIAATNEGGGMSNAHGGL